MGKILSILVLSALLPVAYARGSETLGQLGDPKVEARIDAAIARANAVTEWARARAAHRRKSWWRRWLRGSDQTMPTGMSWDDPNKLYLEVHKMLKAKGDSIEAIPDRAIRRGVVELTRLVQKYMPKKTGTLVRSVAFVVQRLSKDLIEGRVGSPLAYARYVEDGTGIYGPLRRPITPVTKKALSWNDKTMTFAKVKGMQAQHPFAKAMVEFLPRYTEIINEEMQRSKSA